MPKRQLSAVPCASAVPWRVVHGQNHANRHATATMWRLRQTKNCVANGQNWNLPLGLGRNVLPVIPIYVPGECVGWGVVRQAWLCLGGGKKIRVDSSGIPLIVRRELQANVCSVREETDEPQQVDQRMKQGD